MNIDASPAPDLSIPSSKSTVEVRLLHPLSQRRASTSDLFFPPIPGFNTVKLPSHSFLISHTTPNTTATTHILFDLSIRKDWRTGFPPIFRPLVTPQPPSTTPHFNISVTQDVPTLLSHSTNPHIPPSSISAIIWSHHHFDHRGDISLFPTSTALVLGPSLLSTYTHELHPANPDGELAESDFQHRPVRQLSSSDFNLTIANFPAHDYFSDGSLYLLSAPGHTAGHIAALARVTSTPTSTFILLAGDAAHHPGVFRPSPYNPLPPQITLTNGSTPGTNPLLNPDIEPLCHDTALTSETIAKLQMFDACEDILVCIAHDNTLTRVCAVFPETMNDWKAKGWKEEGRWLFLEDFGMVGQNGRTGIR